MGALYTEESNYNKLRTLDFSAVKEEDLRFFRALKLANKLAKQLSYKEWMHLIKDKDIPGLYLNSKEIEFLNS